MVDFVDAHRDEFGVDRDLTSRSTVYARGVGWAGRNVRALT